MARYKSLVAENTGETVKGKANPYTSMNGNMFSFLDKEGVLCLRLSDGDRAEFMDTYKTGPVMQYGAVMKEYVSMPPDVVADPVELKQWFDKCLAYARTLRSKPTRKK